jgi:hypothetical protein
MCDITVEITEMIRDDVLGRLLVLLVKGKEIVRLLGRTSDVDSVIVDRIFVVRRREKFRVQPIDASAVAHDAIVDFLAILHRAQSSFQVQIAHRHPLSRAPLSFRRRGKHIGRPADGRDIHMRPGLAMASSANRA